MSPQITAHSTRSGNVFPLCLGTALRLLGILPSPSTSTRKRAGVDLRLCCVTRVQPRAFQVRVTRPSVSASTCALRFLVRPIFQRRLPAYSVQGRCRPDAVGCCLVAARPFVAWGYAAPVIRGCRPDRRGLAGCAALPIESLVTPIWFCLLLLVVAGACCCAGLVKSFEARCAVLRWMY
jgi:hypothetical protein